MFNEGTHTYPWGKILFFRIRLQVHVSSLSLFTMVSLQMALWLKQVLYCQNYNPVLNHRTQSPTEPPGHSRTHSPAQPPGHTRTHTHTLLLGHSGTHSPPRPSGHSGSHSPAQLLGHDRTQSPAQPSDHRASGHRA